MLQKTSLIIYLSTIGFLSLIFGFLFDLFFSDVNILQFNLHNEETNLISQIASFIMLFLMAYYLIKPWLFRKKMTNPSCCSSNSSSSKDLKVETKIDNKLNFTKNNPILNNFKFKV